MNKKKVKGSWTHLCEEEIRPRDIHDVIQEKGAEGWELVSTHRHASEIDGRHIVFTLFFKQPLKRMNCGVSEKPKTCPGTFLHSCGVVLLPGEPTYCTACGNRMSGIGAMGPTGFACAHVDPEGNPCPRRNHEDAGPLCPYHKKQKLLSERKSNAP